MEISWDQARAFRLRRHFLEPRGDAGAVDIVSRLCGVQAQVASSADLAVRMRQAKPRDGAVARALADGALVKTWAWRDAAPAVCLQAPAFLSLIGSARTWEQPAWQREFGATPKQIDALVDIASQVLDGTILSRDELVTRIVAKKGFAKLEQQLRSGWGAVLKPLAWRGALCHGPSRDNTVTFTRPDTLLCSPFVEPWTVRRSWASSSPHSAHSATSWCGTACAASPTASERRPSALYVESVGFTLVALAGAST